MFNCYTKVPTTALKCPHDTGVTCLLGQKSLPDQ